MRTRKRLGSAVAVLSAALLVVAGCSSGTDKGSQSTSSTFAECATKPNDCNGGKTKQGGALVYTIEKKITGWNLNDGDSNTFDFQQVLNGVLPTAFVARPDLSVHLNDDLLASAEMTNTGPQTIVYKIKPEAVWDDGTPISADDFIYAWRTRNGTDCAKCAAATNAGYDRMKSVTGSDGGKTVTVVYDKPFTDWKQPFDNLYPAHIAKQHGDLAESWKWFNDNVPTFSAGPYKISEYKQDETVTEVPNPRWYGKDKPSLGKLVFRIITDQGATVPALQNNEVQGIYPQPNLDIVNQVKRIPNVQYSLTKNTLQWEHIDLNLKNKYLGDKALRQAIFTAINRQDIIDKTVGQFVSDLKPLNSHMFVPGQEGYKDAVTATGAGKGDPEAAKKVLTDAGYKLDGGVLKTPAGEAVNLRISFTEGNTLRESTSKIVQDALAAIGVKLELVPVKSLGKTLSSGDFDLILFAWVSPPFTFANAEQVWTSTSVSNYGKWANADADRLLATASGETDQKKAIDQLNQVNELLAKDFYVLPLFQKPTFIAVRSEYVNVRDNPTVFGPTYNVQTWGLRAT